MNKLKVDDVSTVKTTDELFFDIASNPQLLTVINFS